MVSFDDLDIRTRAQIVSGVDVNALARKQQAKKDAAEVAGESEHQAELGRLSSGLDQNSTAAAVVAALENKLSTQQLVESSHNLARDLDYYGLVKLISLTTDSAELAALFQKWVEVDTLPPFSNLMAWEYIDLSCKQAAGGPLKSSTAADFDTKFDAFQPDDGKLQPLFRTLLHFMLAFHVLSGNEAPEAELKKMGTAFTDFATASFSVLKFPKASEENAEVDLVANACIYLQHDYGKYFDAHEITQKALLVSYHSLPVMRLWCMAAIGEDRQAEVVPVFKTYLAYVEDALIKHDHKHQDCVGTIEMFLELLRYISSVWLYPGYPKKQVYEQVCDWLEEVKKVLAHFTAITTLSMEVYSPVLKKYMSSVYYRLGVVYERLCLVYTASEQMLQTRIEESYLYFQRAVELLNGVKGGKDPSFAKYYYSYALVLAKRLQYDEAIKVIKKALKLAPDSVEFLNVIVLLYSGVDKENLEKPLAICTDVLRNLTEDFKEGDIRTRLSFSERRACLQMYMTFIALVEASSDKYMALPYVSKLFDLSHRLLGVSATLSTTVSNTSVLPAEPSSPDRANLMRTMSSHRPTISDPALQAPKGPGNVSRRSKVFSKIKSRTSVELGHNRKNSKTKVPVLSVTPDTEESQKEHKMMHDIWLWTSKLFERCEQYSDAEGCVKEAEAVYKATSDSYARMGHLLLYGDPKSAKLALQQLEISLEMSGEQNVEAILGFAKLVFSPKGQSVFISEDDRLAAVGRCKNYLIGLTCSYRSSSIPEVYYYLSKIYDTYHDLPLMENTLWKTVSLEDNRLVRSIDHVVEWRDDIF